jgi:DNA-binding transcriptional LysR family regulator
LEQTVIAATQYRVSPADLETLLALVRGNTLAAAGERLGVDGSTVFRTLQRVERGLGQALFERGRSGYAPNELALELAEHAERMEAALESAREATVRSPAQASGNVRISTTDAVLHGVVMPALRSLADAHPLLDFDFHTANELASLSRRDADIAVRATKKPPPHLVGRRIGAIRVALYVAKKNPIRRWDDVLARQPAWVAPDDALPEHPSVLWRKRYFPKLQPRYRVSSILSVMQCVLQGGAVGVLPLFLAAEHPGLRALTEPLKDATTDLWLLMHPEARHLRRVSTVYAHLAQTMRLP